MDKATQVKALLATIQALAEAIRELKEVPSGHLYAQVMGKLSLENYQYCVGILKQAGKVTEDNSNLLSWIE